MTTQLKISVIGVGNVGFHVAQVLHSKGHCIVEVYSREAAKTSETAASVAAAPLRELAALNTDTDVVLIAVKDDAIAEVAAQLPALPPSVVVAHTSGTVPSQQLARFAQYGVFYPLQTFHRNSPPQWERIPFCICANNARSEAVLLQLASDISPLVYAIDDEQRKYLHLSAVFVNNFCNHLLSISYRICHEAQVPFEILQPLAQETIVKAFGTPPSDPALRQSGPASRRDYSTMARHETLLQQQSAALELYHLLSEHIMMRLQENR